MGVSGYPTIKYFVGGDKKGKDYQGGRDFASLQGFAESKLNKPVCNAATKKGCAANELSFIEKHEGKTPEEIKAVVDEKATELKELKKAGLGGGRTVPQFELPRRRAHTSVSTSSGFHYIKNFSPLVLLSTVLA